MSMLIRNVPAILPKEFDVNVYKQQIGAQVTVLRDGTVAQSNPLRMSGVQLGDAKGYSSLTDARNAIKALTTGPDAPAGAVYAYEGRFFGGGVEVGADFDGAITWRPLEFEYNTAPRNGVTEITINNPAVYAVTDGEGQQNAEIDWRAV